MKKFYRFISSNIINDLEEIERVNVKYHLTNFEDNKKKIYEMKSDCYIWLTLKDGTACFELEQALNKDTKAYNLIQSYDERTHIVKAYLIEIRHKDNKDNALDGSVCELDYNVLKKDLKEFPVLPSYFNNNNLYFNKMCNYINSEYDKSLSENDRNVIYNVNKTFMDYVFKAKLRNFNDYLNELKFDRLINDYNIKDINYISRNKALKVMKHGIDLYYIEKGEKKKVEEISDLILTKILGIKPEDEIVYNKIKNNTLTKKEFEILYDVLLKYGMKGDFTDNTDIKNLLIKLENIIDLKEDINIEYVQELER